MAATYYETEEVNIEYDLLRHLEQKRQEVSAIAAAAELAREQAMTVLQLQKRAAQLDSLARGTGEALGGTGAAAEGNDQLYLRPLRTPVQANRIVQQGQSYRDGGSSGLTSLSAEDRRRFGLPVWEEEEDLSRMAGTQEARFEERWPEKPQTQEARFEDHWPEKPQTANVRFLQASTRSEPVDEGEPCWTSLSADDRRRFGLDPAEAAERRLGGIVPVAAKRHDLYEVGIREPFRHPEVLWGGKNDGSLSMARTLAQLAAVGETLNLEQLQESERRLQRIRMRGYC